MYTINAKKKNKCWSDERQLFKIWKYFILIKLLKFSALVFHKLVKLLQALQSYCQRYAISITWFNYLRYARDSILVWWHSFVFFLFFFFNYTCMIFFALRLLRIVSTFIYCLNAFLIFSLVVLCYNITIITLCPDVRCKHC